ncbi:hypothetical protein [uncultured Alistipes sp.]|uniref:hypothetical protein n=1 Tax=uncultured Alistipes sp. TaxID=538949 RepID=UPI0025F82348|nr:hypothetical protein [uncultured Alistipes sp.]
MQILRRIFRRYSAPERRKKWRHKEGKTEETGVEGRKAERASGRCSRKEECKSRRKKGTQEREKKGERKNGRKKEHKSGKKERKSRRKREEKQSPGESIRRDLPVVLQVFKSLNTGHVLCTRKGIWCEQV